MASYTAFGDLPTSLTTTPWQCLLAEKIYNDTGDGALKSFFGAQGWNTSLIDKMTGLSKVSLLPGADPVLYISANAGVSINVA